MREKYKQTVVTRKKMDPVQRGHHLQTRETLFPLMRMDIPPVIDSDRD